MRPALRRWAAAGVLVVALPLMADSCAYSNNTLHFESLTFYTDNDARSGAVKTVGPRDTETREGVYSVSAGVPGTIEIVFGTSGGYDDCTLNLDGATEVKPRYLGDSQYAVSKHVGPLVAKKTVDGSLRCADRDGFSVPTVSYFSVVAVRGGVPVLSPATIDFGSLAPGQVSPKATVTLRNIGDQWIETTYPSVSNADVIIASSGCIREILKPGKSCTFTVQVQLATSGAFSGQAGIHISVGAASEPRNVLITATGTGTPPTLSLSPGALDFGQVDVGSRQERSVVASVVGSSPVRIDSVEWRGSGNITIGQSTCTAQVLNPSGACEVRLVFSPSSSGRATGQLIFAGSMTGSPRAVDVSGTGVATTPNPPSPSYSPPTPP